MGPNRVLGIREHTHIIKTIIIIITIKYTQTDSAGIYSLGTASSVD